LYQKLFLKIEVNPNKNNNMNHTLSSRNQTLSKGRVTNNLKKPKNEENLSNQTNNKLNNNQFKNYYNPQNNFKGEINKSVDFRNENLNKNDLKHLSKLTVNEQMTTLGDIALRSTTNYNDMSLNNSDIMQPRIDFSKNLFSFYK